MSRLICKHCPCMLLTLFYKSVMRQSFSVALSSVSSKYSTHMANDAFSCIEWIDCIMVWFKDYIYLIKGTSYESTMDWHAERGTDEPIKKLIDRKTLIQIQGHIWLISLVVILNCCNDFPYTGWLGPIDQK